nr:immunoglobulin heavy chain junction region [Mus musculus]NSM04252.1 immunoglobulin heavy chain junction region [Mus musculus]NSM05695.1 immunoglobulin heavy chain junction region [Mus musculus]NSM05782.1 immunoglobulin heavy chain junction region [Mus musculus]NSM06842.1 immunoglobulin heavy chain junction region [Mus musculus]
CVSFYDGYYGSFAYW